MAPYALKRRKLGHNGSPVLLSTSMEEPNGFSKISGNGQSTAKTSQLDISAGSMYKSNLFKLQMDELLAELRPSYKRRMVKAEKALHKLKRLIEAIPTRDPLPIIDAEKELFQVKKTVIPFPEPKPKKDTKYTLSYSQPANINIVGSYALKTVVTGVEPIEIDMAVTMPSHIFQEKDFLNYRYFHKRAFYLACIAAGLQSDSNCTFNLSYIHQNDNPLEPILLVKPSSDGGEDDFSSSKCLIKVMLSAEKALFPLSKTLPNKNCVRTKEDKAVSTDVPPKPTPLYNATLRMECLTAEYLKFLHKSTMEAEGFKDACLLGAIWLRRRGFSSSLSKGGFGSFEFAYMMALLLQGGGPKGKPVLSLGYSSYQLFKALLQFLSSRNLIQIPFFSDVEDLKTLKINGPIYFDGDRGINVLFKTTPWSYKLLQHEAKMTLKVLNSSLFNQFDPSFISNINKPLQRFDELFRVPITRSPSLSPHQLDFVEPIAEFCTTLHQTLSRGLGDRVDLISLGVPPLGDWPTTSSVPPPQFGSTIQVGLLLNPEHSDRTVDHGPPAEDKKAATVFRKFWGDKAELRKFKDGSILESLIWSNKSVENSIPQQVVHHIIRRHAGQECAANIDFPANDFGQFIQDHLSSQSNTLVAFQQLNIAYEDLEKKIRALEGLPLQIRTILPASPELRYASISSPLSSSSQLDPSPVDVVVQFEGSSRWPDSIPAIQRTKIAFLLKIGQLLESSTSGVSSRLCLENAASSSLNSSFLTVSLSSPTPASFNLRIHHDHELTLLSRELAAPLSLPDRTTTALALSSHKRAFLHTPTHTSAVRTLATRFPPLSSSIRLLKKWFASHLLIPHFSPELIELFAIRSFVEPYPWSVPGSFRTAFLRTLSFIAKWDWQAEPLIINLSSGEDGFTPSEIDAINTRFEAWRKIDPAMNRVATFVASNLDPEGIAWTDGKPSKVVAARLTSLARAACQVVESQGLDLDAKALFAADLTEYDFVIWLNPTFVRGSQGPSQANGKKKSTYKNLQVQLQQSPDPDVAMLGYDPVREFFEELEKLYGDSVLLFHNLEADAEPVFAGVWNPATGKRAWRVNLGYSSMPVVGDSDEETQVCINKRAVLNEMARLGGDLVLRIESREKVGNS